MLILPVSSLLAQGDSILRLETESFDILYGRNIRTIDSTNIHKPRSDSPPFVLRAENVEYLKDTSLTLRTGSKLQKLNVNDIKSVKFYHGTKFFEGMLSGALIGAGAVLWLHSLGDDSSITGFLGALAVGVVVAVPCSVIGGIIGLFFKDSHSYNLSGLTTEKKTAKLIRIFRQHRN